MHAYMYGWNSSFSNCRIDQNEHGGTYVGVQHGDQSVHTRMHVINWALLFLLQYEPS